MTRWFDFHDIVHLEHPGSVGRVVACEQWDLMYLQDKPVEDRQPTTCLRCLGNTAPATGSIDPRTTTRNATRATPT